MRILNISQDLDYKSTKAFFDRRAKRYREDNPYSVTMYQDNDAELVKQRNRVETGKLSGLLELSTDSRVLDLACGIGRWADAIADSVYSYTGIDFSEKLISIANQRNARSNVSFFAGSLTELESVLDRNHHFNRFLMIGILMYLNDTDVVHVTEGLEKFSEQDAIVCIREPIALKDRLTLKDFYSDELKENYNAIYRTHNELVQLITPSLLSKGFVVTQEGFLFEDDALNNRKETAQYYFILRR